MKMTPTLLLLLGVMGVYCDTHSVSYYETVVSTPWARLPIYSSVGYVDSRVIMNYDSNSGHYQPKVEWMKKLGDDYWEKNTQRGREAEAFYKNQIQIFMNRFNHTGGLHVLQVKHGCELTDDGILTGFDEIGYDGRDFLYLDTENGIYIPTMNEAQITTQRWNGPEERRGKVRRHHVREECVEFLKKHINNGREDLEKRVRPEVKVWGRQSDGVTKLQCLAYGFHPRAVDVKWVKNDEHDVPTMEAKTVLPHPDGTYQLRVSVEVPTNEEDSYSCHVDHSSLEPDILKVKWEPDNGLPSSVIAVSVIAGLTAMTAVIAGVLCRNQRCSTQAPAHSPQIPAPTPLTTQQPENPLIGGVRNGHSLDSFL